ncbi:MAG TPA: ABC transporter substrate-binding protein [Stellaceae bacterium]|nr:ABC transporter substrate-binding protein [Stellaceae bacterium]
MTKLDLRLSRRQALAAAGGALVAATWTGLRPAAAAATIRQGYQTNMWGMPTYYLMHSGHLEKHGIKAEDFPVPAGNITMQQMVARQVDLGTYAGPSLLIGHDRGGLVAVAMIEYAGGTIRVMGRKDEHLTKIEDLRGKKVANQTGSSVGNIFVDVVMPAHGLHKGDYDEVRMNVNDMVSAMLAKTIDAMVCVEPYNSIAESEGIANTILDFYEVDKLPVFMAATPDFVEKHGDVLVPYLKAWLDVGKDFKDEPDKVADVIYAFYTSKGYKLSRDVFKKALSGIRVQPGFPPEVELKPYMDRYADELIEAKKIQAKPDLGKIMMRQFMHDAEA